MEKKIRQLSLIDTVLSYSHRIETSKAMATLSEIDKMVDCLVLIVLVKGLDKTHSGKGSLHPVNFETKLKMLLVWHTFNLSDEHLEHQLIDMRSFQQFMGLSYEEEIPDVTTLRNFKESLSHIN